MSNTESLQEIVNQALELRLHGETSEASNLLDSVIAAKDRCFDNRHLISAYIQRSLCRITLNRIESAMLDAQDAWRIALEKRIIMQN